MKIVARAPTEPVIREGTMTLRVVGLTTPAAAGYHTRPEPSSRPCHLLLSALASPS
jgi:hypothetical protein